MAEALDAEWFLVANKDKLSIKIRNQVTLGEDERGLLTLESRKEDQRWLTLSVDQYGALFVSHLEPGWQLESPGAWVSQDPGAVCIPGTLISLINNEVYISHDLLRGRVEQHLLVKPAIEETPDPTIVPDAAVIVREPEGLRKRGPAREGRRKRDEEPETLITALPPQGLEALDDDTVTDATIQLPARQRAIETRTDEQLRPRKSNDGVDAGEPVAAARMWTKHVVVVGVVCLTVGGYYLLDLPPDTPQISQAQTPVAMEKEPVVIEPVRVDRTATDRPVAINPVPSPERVDTVPTLEVERIPASAFASEQTEDIAVDELLGVPTEPSEPIEQISAPSPQSSPEPVVDWSGDLEEARALLADGFINWPERNAVGILGQILAEEPEHPEALLLLNDASRMYVAEALRAHRDGFADAAGDMIAEVERFHPNYPGLTRARQILLLN